ncbi:MAG: thioesterase family protein [Leptolinea sp.]
MSEFKFYFPMQIRYGDLDPQWHVNNSHTVIFIETARLNYIMALGLFDGQSFFDLGLIVADVHVVYLAPIKLTQKIRVGVRVAKIGTKSLTLEYQIEDEADGRALTRAETVMVCYDYHKNESKPVPDEWRAQISAFEGWK